MKTKPTLFVLGLLAASPTLAAVGEAPRVEVVATPDRGVQPQAVVDASGSTHLVYLRGDPSASDVHYAARQPGEADFGPSIRVNSEPGTALALGTVRGARIAIGRGGIVHVAWNGTQKAKPINPINGSPLLYSRSDPNRTHFEPRRNLMTKTAGLDGGGSIAADSSGNVYVAWHGQARGSSGEGNRRAWVARSTDDGETFAAEVAAWSRPTGACGCCGTAAWADSKGSAYLLYRAATGGVDRGMVLLTSRDRGGHFDGESLDSWRIAACPMSTVSFSEGEPGVVAAWETKGQVYSCRIDRETGERTLPISPPGGDGSRKHPTVAVNSRGETLLAWTEGTSWQKGGSLAWQVFDKAGRPLGPPGRAAGAVPVWGLASAIARLDGSFTIVR